MENLTRDTWLEVDLEQLGRNVAALKEALGPSVAIYGVLKANAYGCGLEALGRALIDLEVPLLAVATLSEALVLRRLHPTWPVLVMGPTPQRLMGLALDHNIQLTLVQQEDLEAIETLAREKGQIAAVQIKLDTGLRRVGFEAGIEALRPLRQALTSPWLAVKGIFSHLALVHWDVDQRQLARLLALRTALLEEGLAEGVPFHISDSISAIAYPEFRLDVVRIGAALYGMKSYRYPEFPIRQITRLMTRIAQIKRIEVGEGVGYDFMWVAQRPSVIATLPVGYADGYPRELHGKGYVVIRGQRCPIVGIICMDQCMADITDLVAGTGADRHPNALSDTLPALGEDVIVYGPGDCGEQTIAELAALIDSNKNDILTRVTDRVPRVYKPL